MRLTSTGAFMAFESHDGKMLYYSRIVPDEGIWRVPVNGGDSVQVTDAIAKDNAFAVSEEGIYYVTAPDSSRRQFIQFLNFTTGRSRPVVVTDHEIGLESFTGWTLPDFPSTRSIRQRLDADRKLFYPAVIPNRVVAPSEKTFSDRESAVGRRVTGSKPRRF